MADDKTIVTLKGNPSVRVAEDQTIVKDIKVGQPIKRIKQSRFHASSLGGDSLGNALLKEVDGQLVVTTDIVPDTNGEYNLGSPTNKFRGLYIGANTLYIGNLAISEDSYGNAVISSVDSSGFIIGGTTKSIAYDLDSNVITNLIQPRIDSAVEAVIGGAPEALDTLFELAQSLGNDSDAFGTLISTIQLKLDSAQVVGIIDSAYVSTLVKDNIGGVEVDLTTTASLQTIDEFATTTYRSVKYIVQLEHDSDSKYHCAEILLTHNGINAYLTEYALIYTDSSLGEFDATIDGGNVKLQLTPSYTNTSFKAKRISVSA